MKGLYYIAIFDNYAAYESVLRSSSLHLFDQKYRNKSNIVKYYYNLKLLISILIYLKKKKNPVMQSWFYFFIFLGGGDPWSFLGGFIHNLFKYRCFLTKSILIKESWKKV